MVTITGSKDAATLCIQAHNDYANRDIEYTFKGYLRAPFHVWGEGELSEFLKYMSYNDLFRLFPLEEVLSGYENRFELYRVDELMYEIPNTLRHLIHDKHFIIDFLSADALSVDRVEENSMRLFSRDLGAMIRPSMCDDIDGDSYDIEIDYCIEFVPTTFMGMRIIGSQIQPNNNTYQGSMLGVVAKDHPELIDSLATLSIR